MIAILYSQVNCGGCRFAEADLRKAGIEFSNRNVHGDELATADLIDLYRKHRPGDHPTTPVAVLGTTVCFGAVELHEYLRELRRTEAA